MSNFQSKTKELVNTATAAGVLYKGTPEQQFREMGQAAKRLDPGEENETKLQKSINQADVLGQIYGVQWARNKVAQERIAKLLKYQDRALINQAAEPGLDEESGQYKYFVNLVSQRNRVAGQFGISPMNVGDYMGIACAEEQDEDAQKARLDAELEARKPYHIKTKTDDKGHQVYPIVSTSKQLDWNMEMIQHGKDRYQGKQADAMRTVLQRRFAKMPNPMTAAQFKGGPEW